MWHLFQQIIVHTTADRFSVKIEVNVHVFSKTTTVIITIRLGTAKTFQNCRGLD